MMVVDPGAAAVGWEVVALVAGVAVVGLEDVALVAGAAVVGLEDVALVAGAAVVGLEDVALVVGAAAVVGLEKVPLVVKNFDLVLLLPRMEATVAPKFCHSNQCNCHQVHNQHQVVYKVYRDTIMPICQTG